MPPRVKVIRNFSDLLSDEEEEGCGNPNCAIHGKDVPHPIADDVQIQSLTTALAAIDNPPKFTRGQLIKGRTGRNNYTRNAGSPHMFLHYLEKPLDLPITPFTTGQPAAVWDMVMLTVLPDGTTLPYYADSRDWEPYTPVVPADVKREGMH